MFNTKFIQITPIFLLIFPIAGFSFTGQTIVDKVDPVRAKNCDEYVLANAFSVNKYNNKKIRRYIWTRLYPSEGMFRKDIPNDKFGGNYILRYNITLVDENESSIGDGSIFFCISDFKTKSVLGLEILRD